MKDWWEPKFSDRMFWRDLGWLLILIIAMGVGIVGGVVWALWRIIG